MMREYSDSLWQEISRELKLIWQAHKRFRLDGEMRVFTPDNTGGWENNQPGMELWFNEASIPTLIEKLQIFYRNGKQPNSVFLLDPVVYRRGDSPVPQPVGSGLLWATALVKEGEEIEPESLARMQYMGVQADYLYGEDEKPVGIKVFGLSSEVIAPADITYDANGARLLASKDLSDLMDIPLRADVAHHYMFSGMVYHCAGQVVQHKALTDIFRGANTSSLEHTGARPVSVKRLRDAALCWNAYDRIPALFERYGVDVLNLEKNLESKRQIDALVKNIRKELAFIWAAHKLHGLEGKMRLYSEPNADSWRAKKAGISVWFSAKEMDIALEKLRQLYNGGLLPNTPLLLDPVVYKEGANGTWEPVGSGIAWATALCVGNKKFTPDMQERIQEVGALSDVFVRGGEKANGLKIVALLNAPQLPEAGAKTVPGCKELYEVSGANGDAYAGHYLLSGPEYLCGHGMFCHAKFDGLLAGKTLGSIDDMKKLQLPIQRLKDAAQCWHAYEHHHKLWLHFGIDAPRLKENLKYFELCGRDFELLDSTRAFDHIEVKDEGKPKERRAEELEFIVRGWIPRGAVTLIAAAGGTGKSSAAHNLLVKAAIDYTPGEVPPTWLGNPINPKACGGMGVYFSGEDGPAIVAERNRLYDPQTRAKRFMVHHIDFSRDDGRIKEKSIGEFLDKRLMHLPEVPIVVIDPARKYLTGDEDNSEVVSQFFQAIEDFAVRKNAAMVVVHHLQKGAQPKNSRDVFFELRGSQVFIDRPRVVIGMARNGPNVVVGVSKTNIPPSLGMVQEDRVFARNPDTLELEWLKNEKVL